MNKIIAYFLVFLTLFTHSAMAIDVHISFAPDHSSSDHSVEHGADFLPSISLDEPAQIICNDAGGHCSHHQAHTSGLVSVVTLPEAGDQSVLYSLMKSIDFTHKQAPPVRPPKV